MTRKQAYGTTISNFSRHESVSCIHASGKDSSASHFENEITLNREGKAASGEETGEPQFQICLEELRLGNASGSFTRHWVSLNIRYSSLHDNSSCRWSRSSSATKDSSLGKPPAIGLLRGLMSSANRLTPCHIHVSSSI